MPGQKCQDRMTHQVLGESVILRLQRRHAGLQPLVLRGLQLEPVVHLQLEAPQILLDVAGLGVYRVIQTRVNPLCVLCKSLDVAKCDVVSFLLVLHCHLQQPHSDLNRGIWVDHRVRESLSHHTALREKVYFFFRLSVASITVVTTNTLSI